MGAPARRQAAANPHNTFSSVKRIMGRPFAAVQAELRALPYAAVRSFDGSAELWCPAWCVPFVLFSYTFLYITPMPGPQ